MKSFTDASGNVWVVTITIDAVKRVKAVLSVNLLELERGDPPLLSRLATDVILLCDVIYLLVKPQADALNIDDIGFASRLGGDTVVRAQAAFYEELVDFFRQLGRTDLVRAMAAQQKIIEAAIRVADKRIESLDVEKVLETLGNSFINSAGSADSILAR